MHLLLHSHDFDFGFPHLGSLIRKINFPWTFSNIADVPERTDTPSDDASRSEEPQPDDGQVPGTRRFVIKVVNGVRVGLIGLVEKEWV